LQPAPARVHVRLWSVGCAEDIDPITDIANKDDVTTSSGADDAVAAGQFDLTLLTDIKANVLRF